ncbi:DUF6688 domain-containing protein [Streptococcus moroccensis]|uniref:Uncharacterized protein n=1 Tax=Streptococcus moroccensis TaxID=1451356 RepID=A0ABT9YRY0_9STRE|nr:DUF6688 family protein [Streptococcus moroccensis]MDQ0222746.1 hypothetical protein [Streptococcus moroccensis]
MNKRNISISLIIIAILASIFLGFDTVIVFIQAIGLILFFLGTPFFLTFKNILYLSSVYHKKSTSHAITDFWTIFLGSLFSYLLLDISFHVTNSTWSEVVYNSERHQILWSGSFPSIFLLTIFVFGGYFLLNYASFQSFPPLVTVLAISSLYLGIVFCLTWMIQLAILAQENDAIYLFLYLFPINLILIFIRSILYTVIQWPDYCAERPFSRKIPQSWVKFLNSAPSLPLLALLFTLPLLGFIIMITILLGQEPDSLIKAWTETSDWTLSQRIAPPNAYYDEHYLCTVGASGHRKIVKPIRMGVRHGRRVVVNRQLCIANAFEQILEERLPKIHLAIRCLYDRYGYPLSRHIKKAWQADIIYVLMKPLEFLFLAVIYLHDSKPENRIALQYISKPPFTP